MFGSRGVHWRPEVELDATRSRSYSRMVECIRSAQVDVILARREGKCFSWKVMNGKVDCAPELERGGLWRAKSAIIEARKSKKNAFRRRTHLSRYTFDGFTRRLTANYVFQQVSAFYGLCNLRIESH